MATTADSETELTIVREFDAPRDLVWEAWAGDAPMRRWGCPTGFVITQAVANVAVGGAYRCVMRSPEGRDYTATGEFRTLDAPHRLVMTHRWDRGEERLSPETVVTITLDELDGGRTRMTFHQSGFPDARNRDDHAGGWGEAFDTLHAVLADADRTLVIERVFAAPRELVWKCFTEAEHVAAWWGPRGFATRVEELDLRPGGLTKYVMTGPDGTEYPVGGKFLEVTPPYRFVTTDEFLDESQGGGLAGIVMTASFFEDKGGTRLTLVVTHPSAEARVKHEEMGVVAGWQSSFDCLEQHLSSQS